VGSADSGIDVRDAWRGGEGWWGCTNVSVGGAEMQESVACGGVDGLGEEVRRGGVLLRREGFECLEVTGACKVEEIVDLFVRELSLGSGFHGCCVVKEG